MFVKRNPGISFRTAPATSNRRTSIDIVDDVEKWLEEMKPLIHHKNISPNQIISFDETRITVGCNSTLIIESRMKIAPLRHEKPLVSVCSYLPFVSADGQVLLSVYIYPVRYLQKKDIVVATFAIKKDNYGFNCKWPVYMHSVRKAT